VIPEPSAPRAPKSGALDFVARLTFFAAAPFLLVFVAALFPVTGALVQIAFALAVFFAAEAVRKLAARSKLANLVLSSQLQFEAYYRQHPPRPLIYYVLYPLLFPYWLSVREARREFLLFKGYTLASFALLVVSLVVQYLRAFPPELTVRQFLPIAAGTFLAETVVVLMFLMPIVTSVVHMHLAAAPGRLAALLLVGVVSVSCAVVLLERTRDPVVSFATRSRLRDRTRANPSASIRARLRALSLAWKALPKEKHDVDRDGKVEGLPLEQARLGLGTFYKNDETYAFDLWCQRKSKSNSGVMIIYYEARDGRVPIWLAMDQAGTKITDPKKLPKGAFVGMRSAADALE
jgi:hypothetical protein